MKCTCGLSVNILAPLFGALTLRGRTLRGTTCRGSHLARYWASRIRGLNLQEPHTSSGFNRSGLPPFGTTSRRASAVASDSAGTSKQQLVIIFPKTRLSSTQVATRVFRPTASFSVSCFCCLEHNCLARESTTPTKKSRNTNYYMIAVILGGIISILHNSLFFFLQP